MSKADETGMWQDDIRTDRKIEPMPGTLEDALGRCEKLAEEAKARRGRMEIYAASQPQTITCPNHPHKVLRIDMDRSAQASTLATQKEERETFVLKYERCPECALERDAINEGAWLARAGVPSILLHASFKTFRVESDEDRENVEVANLFVANGRGLLVMTGNIGDGKSMLAVAILREFLGGKFITQNNLLMDLRRGYRDPKAEDVIKRCQKARCLVIDDFGLSMGGADEIPMLQSILDHRHGEKLPTVITSNLTMQGIYDLIGPRLKSRFEQSTFRVLKFTGPDSRRAERQNYLAD